MKVSAVRLHNYQVNFGKKSVEKPIRTPEEEKRHKAFVADRRKAMMIGIGASIAAVLAAIWWFKRKSGKDI